MKTTLVVSKKILIVSLLLNAAIAQADFADSRDIPPKDIETLRKEAESGDAESQYWLGCIYFEGSLVGKDDEEAARWIRKSAKQGYAEAQNAFGVMLKEGVTVDKDSEEAFKWFRKAANKGLPEAQFNLGRLYLEEKTTWDVGEDDSMSVVLDKCNRNKSEGLLWIRKAAEKGLAQAQFYLGGELDDDEGKKWLRKAADQGYAPAQYELGGVLIPEGDESVRWYLKAAIQGHVDAQYQLGGLYEEGEYVEKDLKTAYNWYRKAAEHDGRDAEYWDGWCQYFWGSARAKVKLGDMYANGHGIVKDYGEAAKWYQLALRSNDVVTKIQAEVKLGKMHMKGFGVTKDYAEAFRLFREATDGHGDDSMEARYNLGYMYEHGLGVKKDMNAARQWYMKAAERGHVEAQKALAR